jgi:hypothetical protein
MLDAIKEDYPQWDGTSQTLNSIFTEGQIDPTASYARFYSAKEPFLVISSTSKYTSMSELADLCDGKSKAGQNRFGFPLHLGKATWIEVLFMSKFENDLSVSLTLIILGFWTSGCFECLSEQNYVRSIMSRLMLKIQKFGTGM